jgi:hypothetical protein
MVKQYFKFDKPNKNVKTTRNSYLGFKSNF